MSRRREVSDEPRFWTELPFLPFRYLAYAIYRLGGGGRRIRDVHDWQDRIRRDLALGSLPMLTAVTVGVLFALLTWAVPQSKFSAIYTSASEEAVREQDYDRAIVCLCRLVADTPASSIYRYHLALAFEARGETARAESVMYEIAPESRLGFPAAHLWLTRRMLTRPVAPDPQELAQAERHLILLRGDTEHATSASVQLAEIYLRTDRSDMVVHDPSLLSAALSVPELQLLVLKDQFRRGEQVNATRQLTSLLASLRAELAKQPANDEARRRLVTGLLLAGDHEGAFTVLQEGMTLKPDGPFGSLTAKAAAARALDAGRRTNLPDEQRRELLVQALVLNEKFGVPGDETDLTIARLFRALRRSDEAVARYRRVVARSTTARMELAALLREEGRTSEADTEFEAVVRQYQTRLDDPENEPLLPLHAAAAAVRLKRPQKAVGILRQTPPHVPNDLRKAALTEAYIAWDDLLIAEATNNYAAKRLEMLAEAMRADAWNPLVLRRLLDLARGENRVAALTRDYLQERIALGDVPAQAYLLLGTDASAAGDLIAARNYLEQAYRLNPELVPTLYNLARVLAEDPTNTADGERALQLLNAAAVKAKDDVPVRYLRGRVLAALGRWQPALNDLEFCSLRMFGDGDFHRVIARVYDELDLPDLAKKHRNLAASATLKMKP